MKAVVFDFDGTLANTLPVMFHSFRQVFKKYDKIEYSDQEIKDMFGPPESDLIKQNLKSDQRKEAIELYFQEYEANHQELVEENKNINNMLSKLKDKGIKLGVVTGKSTRSFSISLEKLNMKDIFDATIAGDEVSEAKPNPEGLTKVLSQLKTEAEDALYIGDSDKDILAGKEANVMVAGAQWLTEYETSSYSKKPDFIFEHPSELLEYIEKNESYGDS